MTDPRQTVWLNARPDELVARIHSRGWGERSLQSARQRYRNHLALTDHAAIPVIDSSALSADEVLVRAVDALGERIAHGPTSQATADRRGLIRDGNLWVTHQYRYGLTRNGREVELPNVVRAFDCECADPSCREFIQLPIAQAPHDPNHPPLLALAHRRAEVRDG